VSILALQFSTELQYSPFPCIVFVDIVLVMVILFSATPFPPELKGILFYIQVSLSMIISLTYAYRIRACPLQSVHSHCQHGEEIKLYVILVHTSMHINMCVLLLLLDALHQQCSQFVLSMGLLFVYKNVCFGF